METKLTPEAHVKRSIVVRTVETRDGEVNALLGDAVYQLLKFLKSTSHLFTST